MQVFIHDIKLEGKDDFSSRFNHVSDLWEKAMDESLSEEAKKAALMEYSDAKLALEQGLPMAMY